MRLNGLIFVLKNIEAVRAVQALENVHNRLQQQGNNIYDEDIMRMKHVLNSPLLRQLLAIQASCGELNQIIANAKGDTINDFEFSQDGELIPVPTRQLPIDKNRAHPSLRRNVKDSKVRSRGELFDDDFPDEDRELFERLDLVAQGRDMEKIVLSKPERGGLGFSVVGLKSQNKGELGIFIQDVQEGGIAARYCVCGNTGVMLYTLIISVYC